MDTVENKRKLEELIAIHYLGCDENDLELATSMMRDDVLFTLMTISDPQTQTNRGAEIATIAGLDTGGKRPAGRGGPEGGQRGILIGELRGRPASRHGPVTTAEPIFFLRWR